MKTLEKHKGDKPFTILLLCNHGGLRSNIIGMDIALRLSGVNLGFDDLRLEDLTFKTSGDGLSYRLCTRGMLESAGSKKATPQAIKDADVVYTPLKDPNECQTAKKRVDEMNGGLRHAYLEGRQSGKIRQVIKPEEAVVYKLSDEQTTELKGMIREHHQKQTA